LSSSTERILVGLIGKPFGLDGHVTVRVETDDPDRFVPGAEFPGPAGETLVVEDVRPAEKGVHLRFEGYRTRAAAEGLRGHELTIDLGERRQLADDEFWPDELIGLGVVGIDGAPIGEVVGFIEGHAQDRLEVSTADGRRFEVPFVYDLVPTVDLESGTVTVNAIPGLTD
jgi:16S rRNA processing protein RimM